MNYNEIADAYDAQAEAVLALKSNSPEVTLAVLELREKAADCRSAFHRDKDHFEHRHFEYEMRRRYMELEQRTVAARELHAASMVRQANCYESLVQSLNKLSGKITV